MKIYVGNLPWSMTDEALEEEFAQFGDVQSANVVMDRDSGRSRGFGFVEMSSEDGQTAIEELNNKEIGGRRLRVSQAKERPRERRYR